MRKASGFMINAGPTLVILAILRDQALPGYDLSVELERLTEGKLKFQQGTLYPLLNKLQKEGVIASSWDLPEKEYARRIYALTDKGRAMAAEQIEAWQEYTWAIGQVIEGKPQ